MAVIFLLAGTLVVRDVEAISLPAHLICVGFPLRVDQGPHPLIVTRVRFHEVDDIESIYFIFSCVFDLEEIPLGETIGPVIVLQVEIILAVSDLHGFSEISALEAALEQQRLILVDWIF